MCVQSLSNPAHFRYATSQVLHHQEWLVVPISYSTVLDFYSLVALVWGRDSHCSPSSVGVTPINQNNPVISTLLEEALGADVAITV